MNALLIGRAPSGIVTIAMNRPELNNAFDEYLIAEFTAALEELAGDPALRVLVLTAGGRNFSAGADLDWMRRTGEYTEAENLADAGKLAHLMQLLDRFPHPTIARVQGAAFGGGVGLIACCDIAVAETGAKFCFSEVRLGLIPAVISPYVIAAIGPRQARRYFLTAETFTAATAHAIGLVHEVVPSEALDEKIDQITASLLQGAPNAQSEAKKLACLYQTQLTPALISETIQRIAERRASNEAKHGIKSFLNKTKPEWCGK